MLTAPGLFRSLTMVSLASTLWIAKSYAQNVPVANTLPSATPVTVPAAYVNMPGNYIRTYEPNMITTDRVVVVNPANTVKQVKQTTQYGDGLGRSIQTVAKGFSPLGYDLVSPTLFDGYGREQYTYLPYVQTGANDGAFKTNPFSTQQSFYSNASLNPGTQGEQVLYQENQFESSPLNRTLKSFSAGNSWASSGGNHPVQQQYLLNTTTDGIRIWRMPATGSIPTSTTTFPAGTLMKNLTIDEQGHQVVEFKDNAGHVILKKVSISGTADGHSGWLCTYYVYDDLNNLRCVISPKAVSIISTNWVIPQIVADELCFQYTYDNKNRLIAKKIPGAGTVAMVYDTRDRLVFTQDANMLTQHQWLTTFYDALNRPVMTALYPSTQTAAQLQSTLDAAPGATITLSNTFPGPTDLVLGVRTTGQALYEARQTITFQDGFNSETNAEFTAQINPILQGSAEQVTVVNPLPNITGYDPITYTYYDNYTYTGVKALQAGDFSKLQADPDNSAYATPVSTSSNQTNSLPTGNKVRVLGTDQWLTTTTYYDKKGRPVQTISDNLQGGLVVNSTLYDFAGKGLSTFTHVTNLQSGIAPDEQILTIQAYDANDRVIKVSKQI
ncbi:YD repeat-containing protein, partial [Chitinophaga costaii]